MLALLAFIGFSILPLLSNVIKADQVAPAPTPSPSQTTPSTQEDLKAQARGYEMVLQREPDNETALKGLLRTHLEMGDIAGVIPPLERLAKINPDEPRYAVLLAQAKEKMGDDEGAAQAYRTILTAKPGNIEALQGLVNLLLRKDRPEAAIGLLQDTLKTAPQANQVQAGTIDVPSVQLVLGHVYAQQKRYPEANAIYDELIKSQPNDFRPLLAKAIILKQQGKVEDSKPLFVKARNIAPAQYRDQIRQLEAGSAETATTPAPGTPAEAQPSAAPATEASPEPAAE